MATKIRCFYEDCVYLKKGHCRASSIELDPVDGCLTYSEDLDEDNYVFEDEIDLDEFEDDEDWGEAGFEEFEDLEDLEDEDY